jgi:hypothetical protein
LTNEKLTTEDISNKRLLGTGNKEKNLWHMSASGGANSKTLVYIWEWVKWKQTTEEVNKICY